MNKDTCPFLTGNDRMNLLISEGHLQRLLTKQFKKNSDHPFLSIEREEPKPEQIKSSLEEDRDKMGGSIVDF